MASTAISNTGMHSHADFFPRAPNWVNVTQITAASSAASLTLPAGASYVRLTGDVDFYVKWGSTAVSTGAVTDGSGSERVNVQAGGVQRNISSTSVTTAIAIMSTLASCAVTQSWWTV